MAAALAGVQCHAAPDSAPVPQQAGGTTADPWELGWTPGDARHTTVVLTRPGGTRTALDVDFEVTCGIMSGAGRLALAGVRRGAQQDDCVLEVRDCAGGGVVARSWPVTKEGLHGEPAPVILDLFVNDTARLLLVRANANSPMDWDAAGGESWWRISLDTGEYLGTALPRSNWPGSQGQIGQHGILVSCEAIPATPLQLVHWAAVRGSISGTGNAEVGERIQVLDLWGNVLFEPPIRSFLAVISGPHAIAGEDRAAALVRASASCPTMLGPGRIELYGSVPARRVELLCTPSVASPSGWEFRLTPGSGVPGADARPE